MFNTKNLYYYAFAMSLVAIASYVGNKFKNQFDNRDEYELVRQYLLNESPLYGYNKPKIWIHTKFEYNARVWKSFQSRSSTDLNQPYIHLTIKSIIDHCGDDFHICLIDDNTFSKLIPGWDVDLSSMAEPIRNRTRMVGLCELVYYYGGMVLPNSFLCMSNLHSFFLNATTNDRAFVCENINRTMNLVKQGTHRRSFIPNLYIFGANKNNEEIKALSKFLKVRTQAPQFSDEMDFLGDVGYWCLDEIEKERMNLVGGEYVGVKTAKGRPILLENLMEEEYLELSPDCVGIAIPQDDLLRRTKYQWMAVLNTREVLETNSILSKYMRASIISGNKQYMPDNVRKAISI